MLALAWQPPELQPAFVSTGITSRAKLGTGGSAAAAIAVTAGRRVRS